MSHRTLSGFRSENKAGLDDLFAQVLGMLSAEGLITLERVTLDATKIKANASGNTFRGREKIAAHLAAAREQVRLLNEEAENEEESAGQLPQQIIADGDYTNHASVRSAAERGVDFYGSWQNSWKAGEQDAQGRKAAFVSSAFPYDPEQDCFVCPAGEKLQRRAVLNHGHGVRTHVYRAPKGICSTCPLRNDCAPPRAKPAWRRSVTRIEEPGVTTAFKAKMKTEKARQIYAQRSRVAEFVHAWMKERCGLRRFRCRGRLKATMEATWACLSYNLTRWFALRRSLHPEAVSN